MRMLRQTVISRARDGATVAGVAFTDGITGALDAIDLALRRRKPFDPPTLTEAPLCWEATLQKISRHYALRLSGAVQWSEAETRSDVRRISALTAELDGGTQATPPHVAIVNGDQVRMVLATLESLRSWPESRSLRVMVWWAGGDQEPWQVVGSIPGVEITREPPPDQVWRRIQAGRLTTPHWSVLTASREHHEPQLHHSGRRLLLLTALMPDLRRGSGSQDLYWFARHALSLGYEVLVLPVKPSVRDAQARWDFRRAGIGVVSGNYSAQQIERKLAATVESADLVVAFGALLAVRARALLRSAGNPAPLMFAPLDLQQFPQRIVLDKGLSTLFAAFGMTGYTEWDYQETLQTEEAAIRASDLTALISTQELASLANSEFADRLHHLPMLRSDLERVSSNSGDVHVVFVGGFAHPPNYLGVDWFLRGVWPTVHSRMPWVTMSVYGADLQPEWAQKWANIPGVAVMGPYEHEATPYAGDTVAVAPLIYGGGVKGKVVGAIGHGAVVVGTEYASQGLPNLMQEAIVRADTELEFVEALIGILSDGTERERRRELGHCSYLEWFTERAGKRHVEKCLEVLESKSKSSRVD